MQATVIPRSEHSISRADISPNALKVLYRLHQAGFQACLVGGGVRDLLLQRLPKDFDIGTDAHPEEVRQLFRNCHLIGRRFRLAHVRFGRDVIEVATFRTQQSVDAELDDSSGMVGDDNGGVVRDDSGRILSDNVYGSIEEDAVRRDFTVNALYYDIADFSVLDYVGGMADLKAGILRLIGDPEQRYREDPVRMLRAVRFAAKLGFRLHPDTEAPIHRLAHLLAAIPPARLFDETLKLFLSGYAAQSFELLRLYGLLEYLLPLTEQSLRQPGKQRTRAFLRHALLNTDKRIAEEKPVTPAFLYAALLWHPLQARIGTRLEKAGASEHEALQEAADGVILEQSRFTAIPRRFSGPMREIWTMQARFERINGKRVLAFLQHPRFRAAYDFLLLRAQAGEAVAELAEWWTQLQDLPEEERVRRVLPSKSGKQRKRRSGDQASVKEAVK